MLVSLVLARLWSPLTSLLLGSTVVTRQGSVLIVAADYNIISHILS